MTNLPTELVSQETTVDTQSPADVAMWLRRRARINREFAESPPAQHVLEDWQRNVMPHLAFRFEQIADLVERQASEVASWKAVAHDHSERLKKLDKPYHEREAPHCSTCECGAGDVPGCTRSHPHEEMTAECERLTEIARSGSTRRGD